MTTPAKRKRAQDRILTIMGELPDKGLNEGYYKRLFKTMSDKRFEEFMRDLLNGKTQLVVFIPHFESSDITLDLIMSLSKKHGIPLMERLKYSNGDLPDHTRPYEYLLLELGVRRQAQNLVSKISAPDNNKVIDYMTYQPTGASKGSSISEPENNALIGMGLNKTLEEFTRFRGGDVGGFRAYNASAQRYGKVSLDSLYPYTTGVKSTEAVKTYLLGMHLVLED